MLLCFLIGPLNRRNWRACVTSLDSDLAGELKRQIEEIKKSSGLDALEIFRTPSPGRAVGLNGAEVTFLAADKTSGHAGGYDLAIFDELGLTAERDRPLVNSVKSSLSGRDGRFIAISIKGDSPLFKEVEARQDLPHVYWKEYAAPADCALDDEAAWHQANPALAHGIKTLEYMRTRAQAALQTPADQPLFRAHDLNAPLNPGRELICDPAQWHACLTDTPPERRGPCVVGVDLGGSAAFTAAAALWQNGRLEVWAACPAMPPLDVRSAADGQGDLYCQMEARGELRTYPGRVTPVAVFLGDVLAALHGERVLAVGLDRYRKAEAIEALEAAHVRWPVIWRGTGASKTADGSHDVRAFQRAVLSQTFQTRESLILAHAIKESAIRYDSAGNPALDKANSKSRIDVLQAAVIAAGLGELHLKRKRKRSWRPLGIIGEAA